MSRHLLSASLLSTWLPFGSDSVAFANDIKDRTRPNSSAADETDSARLGTDTRITAMIKADLLVTDNIDGTRIDVTTVNGVVTLTGILGTQAQVDRAVTVARGIEGVKSIDTRALKTRSPQDLPASNLQPR